MTTWTTVEQAAETLDVTIDTVATLAGELADDPDLYDERGISEAGMALLAEQVTSTEPIGDALLDEVRDAAEGITEAEARRDAAIRAAIPHRRAVDIAAAAGLSRERVYQIRDGRR